MFREILYVNGCFYVIILRWCLRCEWKVETEIVLLTFEFGGFLVEKSHSHWRNEVFYRNSKVHWAALEDFNVMDSLWNKGLMHALFRRDNAHQLVVKAFYLSVSFLELIFRVWGFLLIDIANICVRAIYFHQDLRQDVVLSMSHGCDALLISFRTPLSGIVDSDRLLNTAVLFWSIEDNWLFLLKKFNIPFLLLCLGRRLDLNW